MEKQNQLEKAYKWKQVLCKNMKGFKQVLKCQHTLVNSQNMKSDSAV